MIESGSTSDARARLDGFLGRSSSRVNRLRKWWLPALAVLALIALVILGSTLTRPGTTPYATETVRRDTMVLEVSATGNLQATRQIEVGSETSGLVAQVFVDNNDRVRRGQPLAQLDTARLRNSLTQAEAALAQAQAQVGVAEATERESADLLARQEAVAESSGGRSPSERELEQTRAAFLRAQAQTRSARAQAAQSAAQVSAARTNLQRATLISPVSGTVLARQVEPGQTVAASFQTPVLFIIAEDLSQMILDVEVDEADIGQVAPGQSAVFSVDAFPGERFPARLERVNVGASNLTDDSAQASAVVSYVARLGVTNTDGRLRPGMTATSTIVTERLENALIVPVAALRFKPPETTGPRRLTFTPPAPGPASTQEATIGRGSRQTVYVQGEDGTLTPLPVEVVALSGSDAAVRGEGLAAGQAVVTGLMAQK